MEILGTLLVVGGVALALKVLYLLAGDVEPDGTRREGLNVRRTRPTRRQ